MVPRRVVVVGELPVNAMGKVRGGVLLVLLLLLLLLLRCGATGVAAADAFAAR